MPDPYSSNATPSSAMATLLPSEPRNFAVCCCLGAFVSLAVAVQCRWPWHELLYRNAWPTRQAVRTAIFEYIEGFYNTQRRHSGLGYLSPAEFEEVRLEEENAA